jgi:hypothetical protein
LIHVKRITDTNLNRATHRAPTVRDIVTSLSHPAYRANARSLQKDMSVPGVRRNKAALFQWI